MAGPKPAVDGMTTRHVLYLLFMHCIGAMILDGGINFGIATAMYKNTKDPVNLWPLPNTLAGDAAVTIIIQQALTWILDRLAVKGDLKKGMVAPLRMPRNANAVLRWFVGLDQVQSTHKSFGARLTYYARFHGPRMAALIFATFCIYWPITIGILSGVKIHGIGKDYSGLGGDFNLWPLPQIFKGVFGFAVGMTTPFVSYVALIYQGETTAVPDSSEIQSAASDEEEQK
ncbi:hypothetical protein BGW38_004561 [Lunasporangiospora selenospora]|uniref:Uncharacterized protein n=1 Tax=Lunasporangiospora selenospora TaxID=979761 RepID=A0A9P6G237_9FUNG|nr:hypothetical protein BGW38_004561 [Lunasporangiospora selenospora]